jgi:low affinity Fe/Cu permease
MKEFFRRFAQKTAELVGSPWMFITSVFIILLWAATGPAAGYSDTWQLIINTGTTIITFLMVFLIQNTQNRDAKAIHIKLDELILAIKRARTSLVDLENCTDEELEALQKEFSQIRKRAKVKEEAQAATKAEEAVAELREEKIVADE